MNHNKTEQIKALLESGFTDAQIKNILDVTDDDILVAMGVDTPKEEPQGEPVEEPVEEPQEEIAVRHGSGTEPRFTEEIFNEAKRLRAEGYKVKDVAEKIGFSASFLYSVIGKDSYDDVIKLRARQAGYKRAATERHRAEKVKRVSKPKQANVSDNRMYIELCSIADSLTRIAEALEKIENQPKKRGLFKR